MQGCRSRRGFDRALRLTRHDGRAMHRSEGSVRPRFSLRDVVTNDHAKAMVASVVISFDGYPHKRSAGVERDAGAEIRHEFRAPARQISHSKAHGELAAERPAMQWSHAAEL